MATHAPPITTLVRVVATACALIALAATSTTAQHRLIRDVQGSGGTVMRSADHTLHGTVSQTSIGRLTRPTTQRHLVGFWYWPRKVDEIYCVRIPRTQAAPGTRLIIPLLLEEGSPVLGGQPIQWRAKIRFNGTLLQPQAGNLVCQWEENDCVLELEGTATPGSDILYEMDFLAKLGNDISTPMFIEEFEILNTGERTVSVLKKHGEFVLLNVCREGDQVRLVFADGALGRVSAIPNPAAGRVTVEYVTGESGDMTLELIDGLGVARALLANGDAEASRVYRLEVDLSETSSGQYFLVMRTPTAVRTTRLIVQQ